MKPELAKIPRTEALGKGPIGEFYRAIKGEIEAPGSSFEYAAPLTEVVLLGAMAQRSGRTIEWDAEAMKVKGEPQMDAWIKEPTREGWAYGERLWA